MLALKRDEKGRLVKGTPPGPGRPKGSVSVITRLKQQFEDDPEAFDSFIKRYKENPANERHITEMIDGKPKQSIVTEDEEGKVIPILVTFLNENINGKENNN